jgi:hypothetical protein
MIKRIAAIGFIVVCTSIAWQTPPAAAYQIISQKQVTATENGTAAVRTVEQKAWVTLPLEQTRANATLRLDYRKPIRRKK